MVPGCLDDGKSPAVFTTGRASWMPPTPRARTAWRTTAAWVAGERPPSACSTTANSEPAGTLKRRIDCSSACVAGAFAGTSCTTGPLADPNAGRCVAASTAATAQAAITT